jgi:membrane protease YdiL (CAAX protease family)
MFKQILTYCLIAYAVTWTIGFRLYFLFSDHALTQEQLNLLHSLAALGPTIGAIVTTSLFYGRSGLLQLLCKLRGRLPEREILLYVLSPMVFFGIGLLAHKLVTGSWYDFPAFVERELATPVAVAGWIVPLFAYAFFEEIGWRGFLLPHLQKKYTAWTATIILTVIWAIWHLPFFFYRFEFSLAISIGFFFGIFVGSIILTSIYNSSKGFLIPVMLFHFLNNLASAFDKDIIVSALSVGFIFLAIYIIKTSGRTHLSTLQKTTI